MVRREGAGGKAQAEYKAASTKHLANPLKAARWTPRACRPGLSARFYALLENHVTGTLLVSILCGFL
jgi:hypothetical protein